MKKTAFIGGTAIMTLILFLGAVTIWSIFHSENTSVLSSIRYEAENIQETENNEKTAPEAATLDDKDKAPEIIEYSVKPGDSFEGIAASYKVSINTITLSNGISAGSQLKTGQKLSFPSVDGLLYKVKSGETLWDISNTYDLDISDITKDNGLASPDKLKIGQELILAGVKSYKEVKTADRNIKPASSQAAAKSSNSKAAVKTPAKSAKTVKLASRGAQFAESAANGLWPVRGPITSVFGIRWGKPHNGIDIGASTGTDVHAYMGGVVVFSGWDDGGYGNLIIIDHKNGLKTYYGHNSRLLVTSGQSVSPGQHIADTGSTGDSTGPHLHFEVRKNGTPVNPMVYLK